MRFQTKQRPRGLLKARDQRRLVLLTIAFGLLLVAVSAVRHPQLWASLFPQEPVVDANSLVTNDQRVPDNQDREAGAANGLLQDEFWSNSEATHGNLDDPAGGDVVNHLSLKPEDTKVSLKYDRYGLPQVPKDLIADVKDNVIGVHSTEATAYNASMGLASKLDAGRESKAQLGQYALFIDAPNTARGRAFRIEGKLRRLTLVQGRVDAFRIGNVYDAWLNTNDSGNQMLHVVASQVDDKLKQLLPMEDQDQSIDFDYKTAPKINFTGYFFKKEAYASQSEQGLSVAPMFVTSIIQKTSVKQITAGQAEQLTPYLWWLAFFILAAIGLITYSFAASDAAHLNTRAHQLTRLPAVASFDEVESETIDETLGRLQSIESRQ